MAHDGGFIEEGFFWASSSSSLLPLLLLFLFFGCFLDMVPSGGLVSEVGVETVCSFTFSTNEKEKWFFFL